VQAPHFGNVGSKHFSVAQCTWQVKKKKIGTPGEVSRTQQDSQ
jgi:hypothetical protein